MLARIPAFQMHYMSAPDAGKREPCLAVNRRDLVLLKRTNL